MLTFLLDSPHDVTSAFDLSSLGIPHSSSVMDEEDVRSPKYMLSPAAAGGGEEDGVWWGLRFCFRVF